MRDPSNSQANLFAAYVEVTYQPAGQDSYYRRRVQWVILPQMPARLAPGDSPITSTFSYFKREQNNTKHRAVWRFNSESAVLRRELPRQMNAYSDAGWTVSPVVTCEIHPTELAEILKEKKTPYRLLNRLKKVASGMHRLDIS